MSKQSFYGFVMIVALGTHALAGEISGIRPIVGPGTASSVNLPSNLSLNNDNAFGFSNFGFFDVSMTEAKPVDLIFDVSDSSGVTEYDFVIGVKNHSGQTWHGLKLELGFGTGVDFILSSHGDGLDFDSPHFDNWVGCDSLASFINEEEIITMSGGSWLSGNLINPSIAMDVPDLPNGEFTLRFTPLPEPASITLLTLGSLMLVKRRRRTI